MDTQKDSSGHRRKIIGIAAAALFVSTLLLGPAPADDLPALRQGLWKFQRTVAGKKIEMTKCTSPTEDMKKMNAQLEKSGCRFSPVKKSGNVYTFTADCPMKTPSGASINGLSTSTMTIVSEESYTVEVEVVADGKSSKELLVAQRIGNCTK